jgi:hypothetical protein
MHKDFSLFIDGGRRTPQTLWNKFFRFLTTHEIRTTRRENVTESCPDVTVVHCEQVRVIGWTSLAGFLSTNSLTIHYMNMSLLTCGGGWEIQRTEKLNNWYSTNIASYAHDTIKVILPLTSSCKLAIPIQVWTGP